MTSTILEQSRALHENIERYTRAICEELDDIPQTHKENAIQVHRVNKYLEGILESSKTLADIYDDKDGLRREEMASISGQGPNMYSIFYDKLRELKDYHRRFPGQEAEFPDDAIYLPEQEVLPTFSAEEGFGRCLDLHEMYEMSINLPRSRKIDYLTYLDTFYIFDDALEFKGKEYKEYLKATFDYLVSFLRRSRPLSEVDTQLQDIEQKFKTERESGKFTGWSQGDTNKPNAERERAKERSQKEKEKERERERDRDKEREREKEKEREKERDRERDKERDRDRDRRDRDRDHDRKDKHSKKEKKSSSSRKRDRDDRDRESREDEERRRKEEQRKKEEANKPVYCTACQKEFAKESVYRGHLNGKKHKKAQAKIDALKSGKDAGVDELYSLEFQIYEIITTLLMEQLKATKNYLEEKLSKTWEELRKEQEQQELEEEERKKKGIAAATAQQTEEESSDEEPPEIKMTIDNYPVGWDGKPIPYWLYKLHGLGVEYKCEICGNQSYWGRKAYEQHFQEWRHAHGMRCLGVPNSKHFQDITKIADAIQLYEKMKKDTQHIDWVPEVDEEFEDREGNVFNRKTFEDLRRQGLI